MNEEEVKIKLILPYLEDLGFDLPEMSFEDSFSIRLGKSSHKISGRSDILCKRNGRNIFLLELKSDISTISQDDIDQGISYARALDEIAPFTLISNGKVTRIFDTITKAELTGKKIAKVSDFWKNGMTLSADIDQNIRYEALKKLVSFSEENLREFCRKQVEDRMGPVIGELNSPTAKFIKELFIQRGDLLATFQRFLDSKASVFGIVGGAGVGKTNAMCSLSLRSLADHFVFFYNAAIIKGSPLKYIAQDLNIVFPSKSEYGTVLKRLDELGRYSGKKVLVFIDAIDESLDKEIALELSEISLYIRSLDFVKLCISCKDSLWAGFIKVNDTPTHLFEELSGFDSKIPQLGALPGYLLTNFSEEELDKAIPLYRDAFDFKGEISPLLVTELKNGFFLRIFSEVYHGKQIPEKINDKELIQTYLIQSLGRTAIDPHEAFRILSRIGKVFFEKTYSELEAFQDDGVDGETLFDKLDLAAGAKLPKELFSRNILIRSNKSDAYHIAFYYSKIRDYIVAFHTLKLHQKNDDEFALILKHIYDNHIGASAIKFYINNASESQKQILRKFKNERFLTFTVNYQNFIEENFGAFKSLFDPETDGDIGILVPRDVVGDKGYALYPVTSKNPKRVIYVDASDPLGRRYNDTIFSKLNVKFIYGSHDRLLVSNHSDLIKIRVFKQLREFVYKGRLNAYSSDILLREQIALIVYYYRKELFYDSKLDDLYLPRFELIYPIDLKDLQIRIQRFRARHFYSRKQLPSEMFNALVEEAIERNIELPKANITGDFPPVEHLSRIVHILRERSFSVIDKHHLPYPDVTIAEAQEIYRGLHANEIDELRRKQYTPQQAMSYLEEFLKHLETCYKEFVDELFPTLKGGFPFYQAIPHEYFFYMEDRNAQNMGMLGYRPSRDGQFRVSFDDPISWERAMDKLTEKEITNLRGISLDDFLRSDYLHLVRTVDKLNTSKINDYCMMRSWIYELLKGDLVESFKDLGSGF